MVRSFPSKRVRDRSVPAIRTVYSSSSFLSTARVPGGTAQIYAQTIVVVCGKDVFKMSLASRSLRSPARRSVLAGEGRADGNPSARFDRGGGKREGKKAVRELTFGISVRVTQLRAITNRQSRGFSAVARISFPTDSALLFA